MSRRVRSGTSTGPAARFILGHFVIPHSFSRPDVLSVAPLDSARRSPSDTLSEPPAHSLSSSPQCPHEEFVFLYACNSIVSICCLRGRRVHIRTTGNARELESQVSL